MNRKTPEGRAALAAYMRAWRAQLPAERHAALIEREKKKEARRREKDVSLFRRKAAERQSKYRTSDKERTREAKARTNRRLRVEAISAYGSSCRCCGEDEIEFLSLDHILPVGKNRQGGLGSRFFGWLKKHGYPAGLQVLCFNCNLAKGRNKDCPHKRIYMSKLSVLTQRRSGNGTNGDAR